MMKKIKMIFATAALALGIFACSSDDSNNDPQTCEEASIAVATAAQAFEDATAENYVDLCNDYKDALQDEIAVCGDPTGDLQDMIDGLDCTVPTTNGTLSMSLGSAPLSFDIITVTTTGTTRHVHGEKSNTDYEIDFDVEVGQTGADKINNFELFLLGHTFTPLIPAAFGNDWGSNITVNTSTSVVGTFHGELIAENEMSVQDLLGGVINVTF